MKPVTCKDADVVYTPPLIAADMVNHFKPSGRILEPCKGEGVFMNYLPKRSMWCEIREGRDFFTHKKQADWIIGNPPYSIFNDWLDHSFKLADNVCYLVYLGKIFASTRCLKVIQRYGGMKEIRYYGAGTRLGFPFGYLCAAVHFERGYKGAVTMSYYDDLRGQLERVACLNLDCRTPIPPERRAYCSQRCKNLIHARAHRERARQDLIAA